MHRPTRTALTASLAVPALLLAACGSDSGSTGASTPAASTPAASTPAASTPAASTPAASTPAASTPAADGALAVRKGELGTYLTDADGRALYLWEADKATTSTCYEACAQAWPPYTVSGMPQAGDGVRAALVGTTRREDGTTQVTYADHPLYYFIKDKQPGDVLGQGSQGFGAGWYVLTPEGGAIDDD